jgi:hypothetical protein
MVDLRILLAALSLTGCVSSEPVGSTPPSTEGSSGDDIETDSEGEDPTSGGVEESHVAILEDCGFALSCEALHISDADGIDPKPAFDCALGRYAAGEPSVIDFTDPYQENETVLFARADRRVVRQSRSRTCDFEEADWCLPEEPWMAWGPHELCEPEHTFRLEGWDCEEVPDFTCDDLSAFLAEPPNPPVPCEDRPQEDCEGLFDVDTACHWIGDVVNYPSDSCEPTTFGACLSFATGIGCDPNPTCTDAGAVSFREREDGTFDVITLEFCGEIDGFERCSWGEPGSDDPPGMLEVGPAACDCAC